jgi:hypothetical protein
MASPWLLSSGRAVTTILRQKKASRACIVSEQTHRLINVRLADVISQAPSAFFSLWTSWRSACDAEQQPTVATNGQRQCSAFTHRVSDRCLHRWRHLAIQLLLRSLHADLTSWRSACDATHDLANDTTHNKHMNARHVVCR